MSSTVVHKVGLHFGKGSTQIAEVVSSYQQRLQDFTLNQKYEKKQLT